MSSRPTGTSRGASSSSGTQHGEAPSLAAGYQAEPTCPTEGTQPLDPLCGAALGLHCPCDSQHWGHGTLGLNGDCRPVPTLLPVQRPAPFPAPRSGAPYSLRGATDLFVVKVPINADDVCLFVPPAPSQLCWHCAVAGKEQRCVVCQQMAATACSAHGVTATAGWPGSAGTACPLAGGHVSAGHCV